MPADSFEHILRQRLSGATLTPRPHIWEGIEAQLSTPPSGLGGLSRFPGADLLLILLLSGIFFLPLSMTRRLPVPAALPVHTDATAPSLTPAPLSGHAQFHAYSPAEPRPPAADPIPGQALLTPRSLSLPSVSTPPPYAPQAQRVALVPVKFPDPLPATGPPTLLAELAPVLIANTMTGRWNFSISAGYGHDFASPAAGFGVDALALQRDYFQAGNSLEGNDLVLGLNYPRQNLNLSVRAEYMLSPRFGIESGLGLSFSDKGLLRYAALPASGASPITVANLDEGSAFSGEREFSNLLLEIPVVARYYLHMGRSSLALAAGTWLQIPLGPDPGPVTSPAPSLAVAISQTANPEQPAFAYQTLSIQAGMELRYQYQLSSGLALFVAPELRYRITPLYRGTVANNQLLMMGGLRLGIRFSSGR